METVTHSLIAVIIQVLCFKFITFPFNILFTIIFTFISHIIVDGFAIITYHTPEAHKEDSFWVNWHIIIYSLSALSIIIFIIPFWLALIFANIFDIWDWLILRKIQKNKKKEDPETNWGEKYFLHQLVDWFMNHFLSWLPKRNYKKSGILIEISIIILSVIVIVFLLF